VQQRKGMHVIVLHSVAESLLEYANNARRRSPSASPTVAICVA
jgi:hypothetical protein